MFINVLFLVDWCANCTNSIAAENISRENAACCSARYNEHATFSNYRINSMKLGADMQRRLSTKQYESKHDTEKK